MKESFSVSGIAKKTGLDRRSIERALMDVRHVEERVVAGRLSKLYDRDETTRALSREGLPRDKIARLAPFGGSVVRLVTWNAYIELVRVAQHLFATSYSDYAKKIGIPARQAAELTGLLCIDLADAADHILTDCDKYIPSNAGCDELLGHFAGSDAAEGEFMAASTPPPAAQKMFAELRNKQK